VIQEYLDLNHMKEVRPTHSSASYYLPHHAVLKPERTTTKLRVVFNASSPSENVVSLNDILHAGPVLQSDLTIQILKWRYFRYVYSADIEKMYRQIWVDPKHSPFQRILFRNNEGHIRDFELQTVRDSQLKTKYDYVIQEYLDLHHMTEVRPTHNSASYYLPHHAVLKPERTITKLRVVFDASPSLQRMGSV